MRLTDVPIGLFRFDGELVLKTEYHHLCGDKYIPDCFLVSSGEYFWGGVNTADEFNNLEVEPLDKVPTIAQPTPTDWIKMSDADGEYYCCNNCGEDLPRYQLGTPTFDKPFPPKMSIERTRFCPNCGARMATE